MSDFVNDVATAFPTADLASVSVVGEGNLLSWFQVTELAVATLGAAGLMLARLGGLGEPPPVTVDRRLASFWFDMTLRPSGWSMPSPWDPVAGNYRAKTGWIRLHTNVPHHRAAALSVLGVAADRSAVARAVAGWEANALETAVVEAGGCAAEMRSLEALSVHPQGRAVAGEPLIHWRTCPDGAAFSVNVPERPLTGLRVLDLTRVLAGPVAGRFLSAYGADVLRIDPPHWDEPGIVPEVTLGKRCAGLDLHRSDDRATFESLLKQADIFLHGYRPAALERLGYGEDVVRRLNPGVVDVSLDAYGWTGPWAARRGFDSLIQMSSGIADYGMAKQGTDRPYPLPVQALDHATGYLMAAAVLHALREGAKSGYGLSARLSLARTAHLLSQSPAAVPGTIPGETEDDVDPHIEETDWGPARRVRFPLQIEGINGRWNNAAVALRTSPARWAQ